MNHPNLPAVLLLGYSERSWLPRRNDEVLARLPFELPRAVAA